jgi:hypothetical protein
MVVVALMTALRLLVLPFFLLLLTLLLGLVLATPASR